MIIKCESCSRRFIVKDCDIPKEGRNVQCGYCSITWFQTPVLVATKNLKTKNINETSKSSSIENVKASDGKTYRFLGKQWAVVMPSGKTGLFAKKKISGELNKLTGRKKTEILNREKHTKKGLNPSYEIYKNKENLPDTYKPKRGFGLSGYIFLILILSLSLVGVIKTFEGYFLYYFPQGEFIIEFLDNQLEFIYETIKNMILIIKDLVNSY